MTTFLQRYHNRNQENPHSKAASPTLLHHPYHRGKGDPSDHWEKRWP